MESQLAITYEKIKKAIVSVTIAESPEEKATKFFRLGTAFCVDPSGIFVSAKHIFESNEDNRRTPEPEMISISSFKGYTNDGEMLIMTSSIIKLALLKHCDIVFFKAFNDNNSNVNWPYIELADNANPIKEGTSIATSGFPLRDSLDPAHSPNIQAGIISRIDSIFAPEQKKWCQKNYALDIGIHHGNSGGPVFDYSGMVVGVLSSQKLINLRKTEDRNIKTWSHLANCVPVPFFIKAFNEYKKQISL